MKREQDQRENQDQEDRVPGELPSLKTDEMSKGNGEGFTRYTKENQGVMFQKPSKDSVFKEGGALCPMRLQSLGR